jgi:hypothetical protein
MVILYIRVSAGKIILKVKIHYFLKHHYSTNVQEMCFLLNESNA